MCGICGCSETPSEEHPKEHTHKAHHHHDHAELIQVEQDVLAKNNQFANANRQYFLKKEITAINLMSSPGSGKTTLLSRTIADLNHQLNISVVVGDQQTDLDAKRLKAAGATAIQVNTGQVCHLDAHMIGHSLDELPVKKHGLLFIENVGNLVCPALFDLGESLRVVLLSVTEGDNKPLKYPEMFRKADLMIITKIDLLPYVEFNVEQCIEYAKRINPTIQCIQVSATTGEGLTHWYQWLKKP